jgi:hypothetical protein
MTLNQKMEAYFLELSLKCGFRSKTKNAEIIQVLTLATKIIGQKYQL